MRLNVVGLSILISLLYACAEGPLREYPSMRSRQTTQPEPPGVPAERSDRTQSPKRAPDTGNLMQEPPSYRSSGKAGGAPTAGPAVLALLEQAKNAARDGDGEAAAASLERAIAIEPQNPWLWHRLAVLRLQQEHWQQAVDLATKSNTLARDHARLLGGNWKVIAGARAGLGDISGANEANALAQRYFANSHESEPNR